MSNHTPPSEPVRSIDPAVVHPYCTFLVVEYTGSNIDRAIPSMVDLLKQGLRPYGSRRSTLLASGLDPDTITLVVNDRDDDGLDGFVFSDQRQPSWAKESSYTDIDHHLVVVYARRPLLAVHAPERLRTMVVNRIRKGTNPPPFRLVRPTVLRDAFLAGEAKGLWLQGVHPTSPSKADTKNLNGSRLQDALDMFDDSTFTLRAGRAALADDPSRRALRGVAGTTPGQGTVWNGPSDDFTGFVQTAREALDLVESTAKAVGPSSALFPELAAELDSLQGVHGAYEVVVSDSDFLPPETSDEARDAALALQGTIIDVEGDATGPNFTLSVGHNGYEAGKLRGLVTMDGGVVKVDFSYRSTPSGRGLVSPILQALDHGEIYTVHYASGQVISDGVLTSRQTRHLPFRNWSFHDFDGYDVTQEKPPPHDRSAQEIHDDIGKADDNSLFAWVAQNYSDGWLTCDDGPGEVADFVHLATDGTLSLIHVKAADSDSPRRTVKVTDYQEVVTQAIKNLHFVRAATALPDRLAASTLARPATWKDGERVGARAEMIERLRQRSARAATRIVIVQPHQQHTVIEKIRVADEAGTADANVLRLRLLETLLTSALSTAVGAGLDLKVIADAK